ncbi:lyase family protein [Thalassotalea sp. PS06]|uniref:lyase family protein n=1 Tax=Thalassotalea sp. PS06 TaxID=2594005 RepID=UPI0011621681|nr:lyase family protein [Thalassotalea sp. PS06]QDP02649.1 hypothetical protein FNC98_15620 [Thalassotalea sp. PS06]
MISKSFLGLALLLFLCSGAYAKKPVESVFTERYATQQILSIEAALARAQAELGIIPDWAAEELTNKADSKYVAADDLKKEYQVVRHRMVALLNVWQRQLDHGADQYMHFGATTVDIYDTLLVLQLRASTEHLITAMRDNEQVLIELAKEHADTLMIGRTLGQHALPITFGKKVSTWLGENRRNIERLKRMHQDLSRAAILKGAVGSYLGLSDQGMELEQIFSRELGLSPQPYISDWHGSRDIFAHYGYLLAMISRSYGRIGQEIFLLQSTDVGEVEEIRRKSAVGSSTMPHKKNPSKSEALIQYSRSIPRLAEVISDDMINFYERDNTSRPNRVLEDISINSEQMLHTAKALLSALKINDQTMKNNVMKTNGLVMSQRLVFALAPHLGKTTANDLIHTLANQALQENRDLKEFVIARPEISKVLSDRKIDEIFDPTTYTGLAREQTLAVIDYCLKMRKTDPNTTS